MTDVMGLLCSDLIYSRTKFGKERDCMCVFVITDTTISCHQHAASRVWWEEEINIIKYLHLMVRYECWPDHICHWNTMLNFCSFHEHFWCRIYSLLKKWNTINKTSVFRHWFNRKHKFAVLERSINEVRPKISLGFLTRDSSQITGQEGRIQAELDNLSTMRR